MTAQSNNDNARGGTGGLGDTAIASVPPVIYHERQSLMRCGVHTLNNLFQQHLYDAHHFDAICHELTPDTLVNPHKSVLGLGNYDINVLITAIAQRHYDCVWFDRRRSFASVNLSELFGVIVNVKQRRAFGLWQSRHWYPIRPFADPATGDSRWWAIDSQASEPACVGDDRALVSECDGLIAQSASNDCQLMLVVKQGVTSEQIYQRAPT